MLRHTVELQRLDMGQRSSVGQARDVGNRRVCAEIEEDALRLDPPRAPRCHSDLDRPGSNETAFAEEEFEPVRCEALAMDIDQAVDHLAFATAHRRHVRRHGPGPLPVFRRVPDQVGDLAAVDHVLAWQARDIGARPADQSALDDNGSAALPSKFPSHVLAGLAATENDVLDLFTVSHDFGKSCRSPPRFSDGESSRRTL